MRIWQSSVPVLLPLRDIELVPCSCVASWNAGPFADACFLNSLHDFIEHGNYADYFY